MCVTCVGIEHIIRSKKLRMPALLGFYYRDQRILGIEAYEAGRANAGKGEGGQKAKSSESIDCMTG